jgi:uncharacterized protein
MTDQQRAAANLAVVQRYAAAWLGGDLEAVVASYHDEITLHYAGANPFAGDHVGKPAALAVLGEISRRANRKLVAVIDVMAGPERACVIVRERFARDGEVHDLERTLVYTIQDEKLHRCWVYDQDQALVDRLLRD